MKEKGLCLLPAALCLLRDNDLKLLQNPMTDPRLYEHNHFVVLEPNQPEQFLTTEEMLAKLQTILAAHQNDLPRDLQGFSSIAEQAQYLLDSSCELNLDPGHYFQWYAVRLEK
jgi:hypothetical protein